MSRPVEINKTASIVQDMADGKIPDYMPAIMFKRKFILEENFRKKYVTNELCKQLDDMKITDENARIRTMASLVWNQLLDDADN